MYNFRLKNYKNGTVQLTYYHVPIRTKEDRYTLCDDYYNYDNFWSGRENDECDNLFTLNPFVNFDDRFSCSILKKDIGAVDAIPDEMLADKRDKSLISSLNRSKRMIYDYGRSNVWDWFLTFTFKEQEGFNRENYDSCKKKMLKWLKNCRERYCPDMKYLVVPEQHESGAWHFHALISNVNELTFDIAVNNQKYLKKDGEYVVNAKGQRIRNKYYGEYLRTSYPDGDYIYNIKEFKNGFTTATKIIDTKKSVSYIAKYITKDLCSTTLGSRRYFPSNNLDLPVASFSLIDHNCLNKLLQKIEYYYNVSLSIDAIKTYDVDVPGYKNSVSVFEFDNKNAGAELENKDFEIFWKDFINNEYFESLLPESTN